MNGTRFALIALNIDVCPRLGERNGGSISVLLDEADVAEYLDVGKALRDILTGLEAPALEGRFNVKAREGWLK